MYLIFEMFGNISMNHNNSNLINEYGWLSRQMQSKPYYYYYLLCNCTWNWPVNPAMQKVNM